MNQSNPALMFSVLLVVVAFPCCDQESVSAGEPALVVAPFSKEVAEEAQSAWSAHLEIDVTVRNSVDTELTLIPPGEFLMGTPESEAERRPEEGPQHRVRISRPFYIGVYEITQGEWESVMGWDLSWFAPTGIMAAKIPVGTEASEFPVEQVTWLDAIEFCNTLSQLEEMPPYYSIDDIVRENGHIEEAAVTVLGGSGYRLPTESEWEYACRAGTMTPFSFGTSCKGTEANINGEVPYGTITVGSFLERPSAVGSYAPNTFGLFDMHGNVDEWCWDTYDNSAYMGRTEITVDPVESNDDWRRICRGGSWLHHSVDARAGSRNWDGEMHNCMYVGLRLARSPD